MDINHGPHFSLASISTVCVSARSLLKYTVHVCVPLSSNISFSNSPYFLPSKFYHVSSENLVLIGSINYPLIDIFYFLIICLLDIGLIFLGRNSISVSHESLGKRILLSPIEQKNTRAMITVMTF